MKLSIIIPVFNEEKTVAKVIATVVSLKFPQVKTEIIVVDDASTDNTKIELKKMRKTFKNIRVVYHEKNQGKGAAIRTAISRATGDYIVIQDADLEYNPQDIKRLVAVLEKGKASVIFGTRLRRWPHLKKEEKRALFLLHFFGTRFLSLLTSVLYGQWITDMETCYKLFPAAALSGISLYSKGFEFEPEITAKLLKNGYRITEIPITTKPRGYEEGKKLHTLKDGSKALWTLVKYRFVQ